MANNNMNRTVKTADTLFDIVDALQELNGATLTELANELDLAKSTVHTYLNTLYNKECVIKDGRTYNLSLKFLDYGMHSIQNNKLESAARPVLEQTAEETGEVVWLIVEEHGRAVYLDRVKGDKAVQTRGQRGLRTSLHFLAAGKCILANMDENRVHEIIDRYGLPAQTKNTITSLERLFHELEEIQSQGYAYNDGEEVKGVRAIGAPILHEGQIYGGISIAGPRARFQDRNSEKTTQKAVIEATNMIELNLKY